MDSLFQADTAGTDATPILDSGILPGRRRSEMPKALTLGLVVGVMLMEILALLGGEWHEHWPAIFLALLALRIIIHELGHLVAGWSVGFRFSSIQIGPLLLESHYGILRAQVSTDMMALGYAGMYPDKVIKLRRRLLIYIAGGPTASLATVVVVVIVRCLVPSSPTSVLETAVGQLAAISLLLAILSLVPITANDGALIEMLLGSPLLARRFISTMALGAQFNQGIRPRDWKQTWVQAATRIPDESTSEFCAIWMAYLAANDRKDAALAAQNLERCLSLTPILTNSFRDLVTQEAVVFNAWFRRDSALAEKWLLQLKKRHSLPPVLQARVDVALSCARCDFDSASAAWKKGFSLVQKMPMAPSVLSLKELWLEWQTEIQQRQAQTVPL